MSDRLNLRVKPLGLLDLLAFKNLVPQRRKRIMSGRAEAVEAKAPMNRLAEALHPRLQRMNVAEIRKESDDVTSYKLVPASTDSGCAYFRAGQYLSVRLEIDGHPVTRPISISSSPSEALEGYYWISVKRQDSGFVSKRIHDAWKPGTVVRVSGPEGDFFYDGLRDAPRVIGIAGGCGITPFRSMARAIVDGTEDFTLTLIYGCRGRRDLLFVDELRELSRQSKGRFGFATVFSEDQESPSDHKGFISRDIIRSYMPLDARCSFFLCGPQALYDYADKELAALTNPDGSPLKRRQIRRELYGQPNSSCAPSAAKAAGQAVGGAAGQAQAAAPDAKLYSVVVRTASGASTISARADETILTALERAKIAAPSRCRSGSCGYCRSRLIKGTFRAPEAQDGRRLADKKFGFVHVCASYPTSDLELELYQD